MPMPAILVANGTSTSAVWFADWMQVPFNVSFIAVPNATATGFLQATYDNIDVSSSLGGPPSVTLASATWVNVATLNASVNVTGTLTGAVRALQINLVTSTATGAITATLIQATFPR